MKPIKFKGVNRTFGANQPEYRPLPALVTPDGQVVTCWEFTDEEVEVLIKNKCIYIQQLTFNQPFQPILPIVELGDDIDLKI